MLSRHTQKPNHEAAKQGVLHTHVLAGHACSSATQSLEDASNRADVLDTAKGLLGFRDGSEDLDRHAGRQGCMHWKRCPRLLDG